MLLPIACPGLNAMLSLKNFLLFDENNFCYFYQRHLAKIFRKKLLIAFLRTVFF